MDFDQAKENIQPLATGRNASLLQASLRVDSQQELQQQRQQYEEAIHNYDGDDPLDPWYNYIFWIEQSFPSGGKESGLDEVLAKCLMKFEKDERYYQDRRMVKLYMKYIDSHENPTECYQQLYNAGIGTMIADLYMGWSYYYDANGNFPLADQIFRKGIDCKAQPLEELKEAYRNFGFVMSQRILHKDNESQESLQSLMHEKRSALTSLRGHKQKKLVGSIRTGAAIKSHAPGKVELKTTTTNQRTNQSLQVFEDNENHNPNVGASLFPADADADISKSVVRTILETTRNQENLIEPGPWNSANRKKKGKLFSSETSNNELSFTILEDEPQEITSKPLPPIKGRINFDLGIHLPKGFVCRNRPQEEWNTAVTLENELPPQAFPNYDKCMLYPKPNMEISMEELRAYQWLQRNNITNKFTEKYDVIWGNGPKYNVRLYPNFAKKNKPQPNTELDSFYIPEVGQTGETVDMNKIYCKEKCEEYQFEELIHRKYIEGTRRIKYDCNETFYMPEQMEETVCLAGDDAPARRRKSFFPSRKSFVPRQSIAPGTSIGLSFVNKKYTEVLSAPLTMKASTSKLMETPIKEYSMHDEFIFKKPNVAKQISCDNEMKTVAEVLPPDRNGEFHVYEDTNEVENIRKSDSLDRVTQQSTNLPVCGKILIYEDPSECASNHQQILPQERNDNPSMLTNQIHIYEDSVEYHPRGPTKNEASNGKNNILKMLKSDEVFKLSNTKESVTTTNQFDVYEDTTTNNNIQRVPLQSNQDRQQIEADDNIFYDINDTCSTQVFNNFIKAQSVSTPKVLQKTQQRVFGTILSKDSTDISDVVRQKQSNRFDDVFVEPTPVNFNPIAPTSLSPPEYYNEVYAAGVLCNNGKQLSTIMESTSEQVTGTTSSKSSIDSPEFAEDNSKAPQSNRKEVEIQTSETFLNSQMTKFNTADNNIEKPIDSSTTKGRDQIETKSSVSIVPNISANISLKNIGNISRLESCEDALPPSLLPIKFQEDKTETIPKMIFSQSIKSNHLNQNEKKNDEINKSITTASALNNQKSDSFEAFDLFTKTPPEKASNLRFDDARPTILKKSQNDSMSFLGFDSNISLQAKLKANYDSPKLSDTKCSFLNVSSSLKKFHNELHISSVEKSLNKIASKPMSSASTSLLHKFSSLSVDFKKPHSSNTTAKAITNDKGNKEISISNKGTQNESFMPDISTASHDTTSTLLGKEIAKKSNDSFLANFSRTGSANVSKSCEQNPDDSFMPNFSFAKEDKKIESSVFMDFSLNKTSKAPSSNLQFLSSSKSVKIDSQKNSSIEHPGTEQQVKEAGTTTRKSRLPIFDMSRKSCSRSANQAASSNAKSFFETNNEMDIFSKNISFIKHSTLLQPTQDMLQDQIKEQSLHIKEEIFDECYSDFRVPSVPQPKNYYHDVKLKLASTSGTQQVESQTLKQNQSIEESQFIKPLQTSSKKQNPEDCIDIVETDEEEEDTAAPGNEMSIYVKQTPKTPFVSKHAWRDSDDHTPNKNHFVHRETMNLNQSHLLIEDHFKQDEVNPFSSELIDAFIDKIDLVNYIKDQPTCQLVGKVCSLRKDSIVKVNDVTFEVLQFLGEGSYGTVFCAKESKSGKKYALKQERPANLWEYYICSELHSRLKNENMRRAFMDVEYALIGNNASILISEYFSYGSIITVCNQIKKRTTRGIDEYVVMHLTSQLLQIIDHLHATNIIHADIKPDNFLLMEKLQYGKRTPAIQLIDFGVSIDMVLFKENQTFKYVHNDDTLKCVEMRENRPWTYQLDLYGLAGVIHVLLFGKYMDIIKKSEIGRGTWTHKTHMPRYYKKEIWDTIFHDLLNIENCQTMPNLQKLRVLLEEEMAEKEKYVLQKISYFNRALDP